MIESTDIAIIGMAGRFPGANTVDEFWQNLCQGVASITHFTDEELLRSGVDPAALRDENYVKAGAILDNIDLFDAAFFGLTPQEARVMDPQQRLFLECVWNALENAGYHADAYKGTISLFGGAAISSYLLNNLYSNAAALDAAGLMQIILSNDKDSLVTRIAYLLNLTGPCYTVQTYCSTSLVSVCIACATLLNGECDMALAGGVSLAVPQKSGYFYQEGGIASPDAQCRAFDAQANGSPLGSGVGVVVLKRLEDALNDGDSIHAIIKGSAVNNDGSLKVGYTAPGVQGQTRVVLEALANADVPAESISYIEAHGTGTALGDAVELTALIKAFQSLTQEKHFCGLGSAKTNVGHLDRAAGVTGLIKTVLALEHKQLPPSLNYHEPNPQINLHDSPFYVNTQLAEWMPGASPRRAGVSAFGIGGTNAHVILEEAPGRATAPSLRYQQLLVVSARSQSALDAATRRLASHLHLHPELSLADVAYTLQVGRKVFEYRRSFVCRDREDALAQLATPASDHAFASVQSAMTGTLAFLFANEHLPDQQAVAELYVQETAFRAALERCHHYLVTYHELDLLHMLLPGAQTGLSGQKSEPLKNFAVQYALAQVMLAWGIVPTALAGWDTGVYVAACLAGVFSLEDAMELVMHQFWPSQSRLSDSALGRIRGRHLQLSAPTIPLLSTMTGAWITEEVALDSHYWMHIPFQPVSQNIQRLLEKAHWLLEIGIDVHPQTAALAVSVYRFPTSFEQSKGIGAALLELLGKLWVGGSQIDWVAFSAQEHRRHVPLPTYPFECQSYWIDPPARPALPHSSEAQPVAEKRADAAHWFYRRSWRPAPPVLNTVPLDQQGPFLVFLDDLSIGEQLIEQLEQKGHVVFSVRAGTQFVQTAERAFSLQTQSSDDYSKLFQHLHAVGMRPKTIVYYRGVSAINSPTLESTRFDAYAQEHIYSLLYLARVLGQEFTDDDVQLFIVSNRGQQVTESIELYPEQAMLPAIALVIAQESFTIKCRCIDLDLDLEAVKTAAGMQYVRYVLETLCAPSETLVAYRDGKRWTQQFDPIRLEAPSTKLSPLRRHGVYLITGGLGNIGLALAEHLSRDVQARLILVSRTALPPREVWKDWLQTHSNTDPVSQKMVRLLKLEQLGAEVFLVQADVADERQMHALLRQIDERYGALHGVIHAAGFTTEQAFRIIEEIGPRECQQHFQAKVHGVFTLEKVLRGRELDFCVLFSSLSAILGGLGFFAYSQANAFMDAIIHRYNANSSFPWISINWDTWQFEQEKQQRITPGQTTALYTMTPAEGTEALLRILSARDLRQVVVSTGELQARIRQWVKLEAVPKQETSAQTHHSDASLTMPLKEEYEQKVREVWQQVLGISDLSADANFFELGGNSLLGLQVTAILKKVFHTQVPAVALYEAPTISAMVKYLLPKAKEQPRTSDLLMRRQQARRKVTQNDIAIIGMAGRFPGATTLEQFWQNLRNGVESITFFTDEELLAAGVDAAQLHQPNYIKARPVLHQIDQFDAAFFGYNPREAALIDPQHRLFMECAWEALEAAGYDSLTYPGLIGVFAGANISTYLLSLAMQTDALEAFDEYQIVMGNDKDALTTSVSYKLNLKGPSLAVQTFCSTSLVATHLACQSLFNGESDIALAGGVSVRVPSQVGYLYNEGGMESPDGHCRTFDAQAKGTLFGDGVGVIVLKRLEEALADGDPICAVIKGSAINNDGSLKVSYTAPSVVGQTEVVLAALASADVDADTIDYVEAHGTATELGDPIELSSLTKAFRSHTDKVGFCALGSVKTNFGHLDRAAGASGLIKTVLALQNEELPPSLHYQQPNPKIDFEHSPFYVNTRLSSWVRGDRPRRAGISSLGMGGTNAHIILEEAPLQRSSAPARPNQLLLLSARTATALERSKRNLLAYLQQHEEANLADVAYTLQVGRHRFEHRLMLACYDRTQAIADLEQDNVAHVLRRFDQHADRPVTFLFPGVGEHYPGMGRELYARQPFFREIVQEGCRYLHEQHGLDLLPLLQWEAGATPASRPEQSHPALDVRALLQRGDQPSREAHSLQATELAHPAVFLFEYALARLLQHWGVVPQALLGYSLGEYVAAAVSEAVNWQEALSVVTQRARLIARLPVGKMLAVLLPEEEARAFLRAGVGLAAITSARTCILAGEPMQIDAIAQELQRQGTVSREVGAEHAFHTAALEPVAQEVAQVLERVDWKEPTIPWISNVTGQWVRGEEMRSPQYWVRQMCETVRWREGVATVLERGEQVMIEVGAGQGLGSFVRQHEQCSQEQMGLVMGLVPGEQEREGQEQRWWSALGKVWMAGGQVNWEQGWQAESRRRVVLPTYPFERQRYWIEGLEASSRRTSISTSALTTAQERLKNLKREELSQWFYLPGWKHSQPSLLTDRAGLLSQRQCWLIFADDLGAGDFLQQQLGQYDQDVVVIIPGQEFKKLTATSYTLAPAEPSGYDSLLKEMLKQRKTPQKIIHLWSVTSDATLSLSDNLERGFFSLMHLAQSLSNAGIETCAISAVSNDVHEVIGSEPLQPERATILGVCRVIPLEYAAITCRNVDISLEDLSTRRDVLLNHLLAELLKESAEPVVALRRQYRWIQTFEALELPEPQNPAAHLRERGVYLITGGLGGIGLATAEHLVQHAHARLALLSRAVLPPREEWEDFLASTSADAEIARKIRQVQHLEELGAEVLILSADVADEEQMRVALEQIIGRFGRLNGVIHAAGMPGVGLMQMKTEAMSYEVLASKVMGTLVLDRVLRAHDLDFLALYSSMTSITGGGPGQVDYCAANAFLDAFAHDNADRHGRTFAINWGEWQWNAWESGLSGYASETQSFFRTHRERFGIRFDEGFHAFLRILGHALPQVIVSTQNFPTLVELSSSFTTTTVTQKAHRSDSAGEKHARPALANHYLAPGNKVEEAIAELWEEFLGIEGIGIHDNFFELGGHSLIGTQVTLRLRQFFRVHLPMAALFEAPTVAELAILVELALIEEIEQLDDSYIKS